MNNKQSESWNKLNNLYIQYPVKPLKFGFTTPSLKDATQYDYPGFLRDWSKDKRKTSIPDYKKENDVNTEIV